MTDNGGRIGVHITTMRATGCESHRSPLRALIVEDHQDFANTLAEAIRSLGMKVAIEFSIEDALARLDSDPQAFDVVLSDLHFPQGKDGLALAAGVARLRASGRGCEVRSLVAISGLDEADQRVAAATDAGFSRFLRKPISLEQIEALLADLQQTDS